MSKSSCSVENCAQQHYAKGLCSKHYAQQRRSSNARKCEVAGCGRPYVASGYCAAHYRRVLTAGSVGDQPIQRREKSRPCSVDGCSRPHRANGLCEGHNARLRRGAPLEGPITEYGTRTTCVRDGCGRPHVANGYCSTHVSRSRHLWVKYGMTYEEYDALYDEQEGRCALCSAPMQRDVGSKHTHVDHDHTTGKVRGILCHGCNTALGLFKDDPALLRAAAGYIERHQDNL